jgi:hypothetical protein
VLIIPEMTWSGGSNAVTNEGQSTNRSMLASHTNETLWVLVCIGSATTALLRSPRITPHPQ